MSIVICSLVLAMIVQIYFSAKSAQQIQTAINDIEFNATRTITILSNELKRAGHIGCARLSADFPLKQNEYINANNVIVGTQNEIQVRYVDLPGVVLKQNTAGMLVTTTDREFNANDILMISDCQKAEVFRVKTAKSSDNVQYITPETPLVYQYDANAEIGRLVSNRYYVDTGDTSKNLFVEDIDHKHKALVDHVSALSFVYTIRRGSQLTDVKANEVADWSQILGVSADIKVVTTVPELEKIWHMYVAIS